MQELDWQTVGAVNKKTRLFGVFAGLFVVNLPSPHVLRDFQVEEARSPNGTFAPKNEQGRRKAARNTSERRRVDILLFAEFSRILTLPIYFNFKLPASESRVRKPGLSLALAISLVERAVSVSQRPGRHWPIVLATQWAGMRPPAAPIGRGRSKTSISERMPATHPCSLAIAWISWTREWNTRLGCWLSCNPYEERKCADDT
ncbi:hypothetical protein VTK26DRAFT_7000 [Humicola hyalothermophila]